MGKINEHLLTVSIIEDNVIYADWIKKLISAHKELKILTVNDNGKDGISSIKNNPPDIVLLDFQLKDMTGLEVAKRIKAHHSQIKIFMLTAHTDMMVIHRMIDDKNINAIAIKTSPYFEEHFLSAVLQIQKEGSYLDPSLLSKLRESRFFKGLNLLTKREFEIFIQIKIGKNEVKIAEDLNVELSHVRNMKSKIVKKINDDNVFNLVTKLAENASYTV